MSEESVRLAKRMTELGLCSRREADEFIEQGMVKVDGEVVRVLGSRVLPQQNIELTRPETTQANAHVTLLVYKPSDCAEPATTLIRPQTRSQNDRSGINFLPRHCRQLTHVGAVDPRTSGLLVMTQDGRLAHKLLECEMEFLLQVDAAPEGPALNQLSNSLNQNAAARQKGKVTRQSDRQLRFVVHQAQADRIWSVCEQAGIKAGALRCIRIGRIALGDLQSGQWRYLLTYERF